MSFSSSLFLSLLTVLLSVSSAFNHDGRSVNSPYAVSKHSADLKIVPGGLGSSKHLHQNSARSLAIANQSIPVWDLSTTFAAIVEIGDQFFYLVVDTGSSDTWVPETFFTCLYGTIGPYSSPISQSYCAFGDTFDRSDTAGSFSVIPDANFYVTYYDGTSAAGLLASVDVGLAPELTVSAQQIGVATLASWNSGDNITSGILGMGYSAITSKYPGTNIWDDVPCPIIDVGSSNSASNLTCNTETYPAITESLFQTPNNTYGLSDNVFTLALSRDDSDTYNGGSITYGGTPDLSAPGVNVTCSFSTVPIEPLINDPSQQTTEYAITLDGIMLPASGDNLGNYTQSSDSKSSRVRRAEYLERTKSRRSTENVLHPASGDGKTSQYVIDSGTTLTLLPETQSAAFNMMFSPPAYRDYHESGGLWTVSCDNLTYIPDLGFSIGGEVFYHNHADLVVRVPTQQYNPVTGAFETTEICLSAIQDYISPRSGIAGILGQQFLKNVLAVFDIGRSELGFAGRMYYDS